MNNNNNTIIKPIQIEQACKDNNIKFIETIEQSVNKWNRKNEQNMSYVDIAIENKNYDMAEILITKGCKLNLDKIKYPIDIKLQNILDKNILNKNILNENVESNNMNTNVSHEITTKMRKILHDEIVKLVHNCNTTIVDIKNFLSMHKCSTETVYENLTIKNELLLLFCNGHYRTYKETQNVKKRYCDYNEQKIITYHFKHDVEIITYLLEQGANPNCVRCECSGWGGSNDLTFTSIIGELSKTYGNRNDDENIIIIDLLLKHGADINFGKILAIYMWLEKIDNSDVKNNKILNHLCDKKAIIDESVVRNRNLTYFSGSLLTTYCPYVNKLLFLQSNGFEFTKDDIVKCLHRVCEYSYVESYLFLTNLPVMERDILINLDLWKYLLPISLDLWKYLLPINLVCGYEPCEGYELVKITKTINRQSKIIIDDMFKKWSVPVDIKNNEGKTSLYYAVTHQCLQNTTYLINTYDAQVTKDIINVSLRPNLINSNDKSIIFAKVFGKFNENESENAIDVFDEYMEFCYKYCTAGKQNSDILKNIIETIMTNDQNKQNNTSKILNSLCMNGYYEHIKLLNCTKIENGLLSEICKIWNIGETGYCSGQNMNNLYMYMETIKVMLLIDNTIINETDNDKKTPLHHLCKNKGANHELLKLLLNFGADVDATDKFDKIPYEYAYVHSKKIKNRYDYESYDENDSYDENESYDEDENNNNYTNEFYKILLREGSKKITSNNKKDNNCNDDDVNVDDYYDNNDVTNSDVSCHECNLYYESD